MLARVQAPLMHVCSVCYPCVCLTICSLHHPCSIANTCRILKNHFISDFSLTLVLENYQCHVPWYFTKSLILNRPQTPSCLGTLHISVKQVQGNRLLLYVSVVNLWRALVCMICLTVNLIYHFILSIFVYHCR